MPRVFYNHPITEFSAGKKSVLHKTGPAPAVNRDNKKIPKNTAFGPSLLPLGLGRQMAVQQRKRSGVRSWRMELGLPREEKTGR